MSYNKERNTPITKQALQNGLNVILRNIPANILTVDFENHTKNVRKFVDAVDAANKAKQAPEQEWRQELDELTRRLQNQLTTAEAKAYSDNQEQLHRDAVKVVEDEIKYLKKLMETPGLSQCLPLREGKTPVNGDKCDVCLFTRKIEAVQMKLVEVKRKQQSSIRQCGEIVRCAKELDEYRPRYAELLKREKQITEARRNIREHKTVQQPQRSQGSSWLSPGGMEIEK